MSIFSPKISHVPKGLEGKTILVYGDNRCGKTYQGTRFPKPFYLPFENGINGIAGIPFEPINRWSDFLKVNNELTGPATVAQARELYQTIIFDGVEASALMCQDFTCQKEGAQSIAKGNGGYGLWKEYEQEFFKQINNLTSCGYTVYFISHETTHKETMPDGTEYSRIYPTGDKRSIDPICNLVDIIAYARGNGIDPTTGEELKSSLYMANDLRFKAGSRFDYLQPKLEVFTAENLEKAIAEAVEKQEKADGGSTIDYSEFQQEHKIERASFTEMKEEIKEYAMSLQAQGEQAFKQYIDIVEEYLGQGGSVMEASPKQEQSVELILADLKKLNIEL